MPWMRASFCCRPHRGPRKINLVKFEHRISSLIFDCDAKMCTVWSFLTARQPQNTLCLFNTCLIVAFIAIVQCLSAFSLGRPILVCLPLSTSSPSHVRHCHPSPFCILTFPLILDAFPSRSLFPTCDWHSGLPFPASS